MFIKNAYQWNYEELEDVTFPLTNIYIQNVQFRLLFIERMIIVGRTNWSNIDCFLKRF